MEPQEEKMQDNAPVIEDVLDDVEANANEENPVHQIQLFAKNNQIVQVNEEYKEWEKQVMNEGKKAGTTANAEINICREEYTVQEFLKLNGGDIYEKYGDNFVREINAIQTRIRAKDDPSTLSYTNKGYSYRKENNVELKTSEGRLRYDVLVSNGTVSFNLKQAAVVHKDERLLSWILVKAKKFVIVYSSSIAIGLVVFGTWTAGEYMIRRATRNDYDPEPKISETTPVKIATAPVRAIANWVSMTAEFY